jgi:hypothetical protein
MPIRVASASTVQRWPGLLWIRLIAAPICGFVSAPIHPV